MELILSFFPGLIVLLWLVNRFPPKDMTEEYLKIIDRDNKILETYRRKLANEQKYKH